MFGKVTMGSLALALLLGTESVEAVQLKYNNWNPDLTMTMVSAHKAEPKHNKKKHAKKHKKAAKWPNPEYDNDPQPQAHPNFPTGPYNHAHEDGVQPPSDAKKTTKKQKKTNKQAKAQMPKGSDPACTSIECKLDTADPFTKKTDPPFKTDYRVPDLGMDKDIKDTQKSIADAEAKGGKIKLPDQKNLVQSDPICGTGDCPEVHRSAADQKDKHPVDYPVPNFGEDPDIASTLAHEKEASQEHGHEWVIEKDKPVPTETVEFKLTAVKSEVNADSSSDPYFTSRDGYEVRHYKGEGAESLANAIEADMPIPDHHVPYDFNPKLDEDIIHTHAHMANAGKYISTAQVASEVDALEKEFNEIKKNVQEDHAAKVKEIAVAQMNPNTPSLAQTGTGVMTAEKSAAKFQEVRKMMMSNWGTK